MREVHPGGCRGQAGAQGRGRQGHRQKQAGVEAEATASQAEERGAGGWVKGREGTAALNYWKEKCVLPALFTLY